MHVLSTALDETSDEGGRVPVLVARAAALLKLRKPLVALTDATAVTKASDATPYHKCTGEFRRGQALFALEEYEASKAAFKAG